MNLLFYLPHQHLSIYLISHLLYLIHQNPSLYPFHIYLFLDNDLQLSVENNWYSLLQKYHLDYLFQNRPENHLSLIPYSSFLQIVPFLKKNMDIVFFELPLSTFQQQKSSSSISFLKKHKKYLSLLSKPILSIIPLSWYPLSHKYWIQPLLKINSHHSFFYIPLILGEYKRGILNKHPFISQLFHSISSHQLISHESIHHIFYILVKHLTSFHSSSEKNIHFIYNQYTNIHYPHSIQNQSTHSNFIQHQLSIYHQQFSNILSSKKINILSYSHPVSLLPYFLYHDYKYKYSLLPQKNLDIPSTCMAFFSLNIIGFVILFTIFIYQYLHYKKFIYIFIALVLIKVPPILSQIRHYLYQSFSSIYDYYSGHIIFDNENDILQNQHYIFAWNPHHIIPLGSFLSILSEQFRNKMKSHKKIHHICHDILTKIPFVSHFMNLIDFTSSSKSNIEFHLQQKESIGLWIGGVSEMITYHPNYDILYIKKRKGIFELAIQYGVPIIPTFTFGEVQTYDMKLEKFQSSLLQYSFSFPTIHTTIQQFFQLFYFFRQKPNYLTVIGSPIQVQQKNKEDITESDIEFYKQQYITSIQFLYEKYKSMRYSQPRQLIIL